jgi:hypothetical protein
VKLVYRMRLEWTPLNKLYMVPADYTLAKIWGLFTGGILVGIRRKE